MIPRYPFVVISPVSPRTPDISDVTCSSCGMLHAAIGDQDARQKAAAHRDLHLVVAATTAVIAAAGGVAMAYTAHLLNLTPVAVGAAAVTAGTIVGAAGGLAIAMRVLSPARRAGRQPVRGRRDA
jgi:hypothetical protein